MPQPPLLQVTVLQSAPQSTAKTLTATAVTVLATGTRKIVAKTLVA